MRQIQRLGEQIAPPGNATAPSLFGFLGNLARWGENLTGTNVFVWLFAGLVGMLIGMPLILAIVAALGIFSRPAAQQAAPTNVGSTSAIVGRVGSTDATAGRPDMSKPLAATAQPSSPSAFVARLAAADCEWVDPGSALPEDAMLTAGQKLELASGQVKIVFQSGAEVKLLDRPSSRSSRPTAAS